jgi:uridine kinase
LRRRRTRNADIVSFALLAQRILDLPEQGTRLVAIDGGGGSGKTTFAARLAAGLGGAPIVPTDDFASAEIPIDWWPRMRDQVILPLRKGGSARYQRYDWPTGELAEWVEVPQCPVVIIEGVSSGRLEWASELAFLIWVEAPRRVRLASGLERDGAAARQLWLGWMAAEDRYRRLHRPSQRADLIVAGAPTGRHDLASEFLQLRGVRTIEDHL